MRVRARVTRAAPAVLAAVLAAGGPGVWAAKAQLGDSSGGGTPVPIEGSDLEIAFNPLVAIEVQAGDSLTALILRLVQGINQAGAPLYVAQPAGADAFDVRRTSGEELDDIRIREDDPAIQSITVSLQRPGRTGQILVPFQTPGTGEIVVTLNDRTVRVPTDGLATTAELTEALLAAIWAADFAAEASSPLILVHFDRRNGSGITRLGWRSTDPALVSSDVAILPESATGAGAGGSLRSVSR
jgi:hypothetical protein